MKWLKNSLCDLLFNDTSSAKRNMQYTIQNQENLTRKHRKIWPRQPWRDSFKFQSCNRGKNVTFLYINIKITIYATFHYTLTTMQHYKDDTMRSQKTMSTPWPTHRNIEVNRQLNKHLQNGTHTIQYWKVLESVSP